MIALSDHELGRVLAIQIAGVVLFPIPGSVYVDAQHVNFNYRVAHTEYVGKAPIEAVEFVKMRST